MYIEGFEKRPCFKDATVYGIIVNSSGKETAGTECTRSILRSIIGGNGESNIPQSSGYAARSYLWRVVTHGVQHPVHAPAPSPDKKPLCSDGDAQENP